MQEWIEPGVEADSKRQRLSPSHHNEKVTDAPTMEEELISKILGGENDELDEFIEDWPEISRTGVETESKRQRL
jgi:hypothetical protein